MNPTSRQSEYVRPNHWRLSLPREATREERLVALLRECQFALTGPAELRQRIEDEIGSRGRR